MDLVLRAELGEGGYGKVYLGEVGNDEYAVKEIAAFADTHNGPLQLPLTEICIMRAALHSNLAFARHVHVGSDLKTYIIQDRAICDMLQYAKHNKPSEEDLFTFFEQALMGLHHLHSLGIAHCDIKPNNILIFQHKGEYVARLVDFGISHVFAFSSKPTHEISNILYQSPEVQGKEVWSSSTDIWSLAVTMYEVKYGVHLFHPSLAEESSTENMRASVAHLLEWNHKRYGYPLDEATRVYSRISGREHVETNWARRFDLDSPYDQFFLSMLVRPSHRPTAQQLLRMRGYEVETPPPIEVITTAAHTNKLCQKLKDNGLKLSKTAALPSGSFSAPSVQRLVKMFRGEYVSASVNIIDVNTLRLLDYNLFV